MLTSHLLTQMPATNARTALPTHNADDPAPIAIRFLQRSAIRLTTCEVVEQARQRNHTRRREFSSAASLDWTETCTTSGTDLVFMTPWT